MDFIIQKATELGVARIVPVLSQRSVVRLDGAQAESKAVHWRAVALNACEQCGRNRLPTVDAPLPLLDYLGGSSSTAPRLVLEPEPGTHAATPAIDTAVKAVLTPRNSTRFASPDSSAWRWDRGSCAPRRRRSPP
jgi:16S rRNA (uracil1498-N3)-methyltransferase